MRTRTTYALLILLTFICTSLQAAKIVQPPIQDLFKERHQIAVLKLRSIDRDAGKAEFRQVTDLWQETDDEMILALPDYLFDELTVGERYIIGHSKFRKHPMLRDVIQPNPNGPSVVPAFVVQHALFEDSKALRYLFRELQDEEPNARKVITRLLDLLEHEQGRARLLSAFEFEMSRALYADGLRDSHLRQLRGILAAGQLSAEEEEFVLRASQQFPERLRQSWIIDHCRRRLDRYGVEYDLKTFIPQLIRTCTSLISTVGNNDDLPRLSALLHSNAPGVAKSAIKALTAIAPESVPELLSTALNADQPLHAETERVIQAFLASVAPE